ncbi:putative monoacyl phosphatidylinositol tetramannoside-binding protein LpqW precursor [Corynebacterium kalinowskii]|uniref:Monoacyl phosphatidylinositol tetramannoside-binding protein LpqW n=2 Tax=Corynebacterium kalinowskii TaxID=2675216 RepID=A0A6B8VHD2_9CORY|nr:putative monoacyl phosphatidylinositol tetramannoside-binding protein LpqW precursor [Corynebacterium kalinowskii]
MAQPGPAPVEPSAGAGQTTVVPEVPVDKKNRNEITVGIDPIRTGFNPHRVSDDTAFVQSLARLVLPSSFVDGHMNKDLLVSAAEIAPTDGAAQVVQYRINSAAQWSDGSPITGADFRYLWEQLSSQPGVINSAGYQSISDVRTSEGGKLVTVVFHRKVADWHELFNNLLPSHLLSVGAEDFSQALGTQVPASAGRYMVRGIDRKRGVVELARNDRFWGADPADVELLTFQEVATVSRSIEMLRSGQLSFAHVTPSETSRDALVLAEGLQHRFVDRNVQLTATFNTQTVSDAGTRAAIASALDIPLLARLASGRSADLAIAEVPGRTVVDEGVRREAAHSLSSPLKVAADPADETARAAAMAIVDMLHKAGFSAQIVQSDLADITGKRMAAGEVDMVVTWQRSAEDTLTAASRYSCPPDQTKKPANLAGWCDTDATDFLAAALAGHHEETAAVDLVRTIEAKQTLSVPIMTDRRIDILGAGIVTGESSLEKWPVVADASVLATAYEWKDE